MSSIQPPTKRYATRDNPAKKDFSSYVTSKGNKENATAGASKQRQQSISVAPANANTSELEPSVQPVSDNCKITEKEARGSENELEGDAGSMLRQLEEEQKAALEKAKQMKAAIVREKAKQKEAAKLAKETEKAAARKAKEMQKAAAHLEKEEKKADRRSWEEEEKSGLKQVKPSVPFYKPGLKDGSSLKAGGYSYTQSFEILENSWELKPSDRTDVTRLRETHRPPPVTTSKEFALQTTSEPVDIDSSSSDEDESDTPFDNDKIIYAHTETKIQRRTQYSVSNVKNDELHKKFSNLWHIICVGRLGMSDSDAEDLKEFGHSLFFDGGLRSEYFFKAAVLSGRLQTLAEKSSNPLALAFAEGLALFFRSDTRRNIPKSRKLAYHSSSDTDHSQRSESHSSRSLSPQVVSMSRSKRPFRSPTKTSPNPVSKKKKKSVVVKPSLNPKRTLPVILDHFLQMTRHCQALKSKPRDYGVKPETTFQSYFKKHWSRYKFNYTFQAVGESYTLGAALVFYPKTTIKELQLISTSIGSKDLYRNAGRIFEESSKKYFSHHRVQRERITTIKRSIDKVASQFSSEKFAAFGFDHVIKQHMDAGMTEVEFVDLKKNIVQPGSEYSAKDLSDADGDEDEDEEDDINVMLGLGSKEETENSEFSDDYGTVLAGVVNGENEEVENGNGLEQSEIENDIDEEFAELGFTPINL